MPAELSSLSEVLWTVAVTEEDQRELTTSQVVLLYAAGTIDEGTYVWRDGMDDWCAPFEAPELRRALQEARISPRPAEDDEDGEDDEDDEESDNAVGFDDSDETLVADSPLASEQQMEKAGMWHEPGRVADGAPSFEDVTVSMDERETQGLLRKARQVDLGEDDATAKVRTPFADAARAAPRVVANRGGFQFDDEEVTRAISTSEARAPLNVLAPDPTPAFELSQRKSATSPSAGSEASSSQASATRPSSARQLAASDSVTTSGERNESSVTFSLEALTRKSADPSRPPPAKQSINSLTDATAGPKMPTSAPGPHRGLPTPPRKPQPEPAAISPPEPGFAPSPNPVAAPVAARPVLPSDFDEAELDVPAKRSSRVPLVLALLVVGAAIASFALRQPIQLWVKVHELSGGRFPTWPGLSAPTSTPAADTQPAVAQPSPAPPSPEPQPAPTAEASVPPPPATEERTTEADEPTTIKRSQAKARKTGAVSDPEKAAADVSKPEDAEDSEPSTSDSDAPEFDRSAAAEALGAAAASAASCKTADGPTGRGRATVTFSNSGRAVDANVTGAFAGTDVGSCVARLFRQAKVPAFSGTPVRVAKSFTIE